MLTRAVLVLGVSVSLRVGVSVSVRVQCSVLSARVQC